MAEDCPPEPPFLVYDFSRQQLFHVERTDEEDVYQFSPPTAVSGDDFFTEAIDDLETYLKLGGLAVIPETVTEDPQAVINEYAATMVEGQMMQHGAAAQVTEVEELDQLIQLKALVLAADEIEDL
jgi:hypothetical protein